MLPSIQHFGKIVGPCVCLVAITAETYSIDFQNLKTEPPDLRFLSGESITLIAHLTLLDLHALAGPVGVKLRMPVNRLAQVVPIRLKNQIPEAHRRERPSSGALRSSMPAMSNATSPSGAMAARDSTEPGKNLTTNHGPRPSTMTCQSPEWICSRPALPTCGPRISSEPSRHDSSTALSGRCLKAEPKLSLVKDFQGELLKHPHVSSSQWAAWSGPCCLGQLPKGSHGNILALLGEPSLFFPAIRIFSGNHQKPRRNGSGF